MTKPFGPDHEQNIFSERQPKHLGELLINYVDVMTDKCEKKRMTREAAHFKDAYYKLQATMGRFHRSLESR